MISKALGAASVRPAILSILAREDSYGYEIIQVAHRMSDGSLDLKPGVLYPILRRMEKDGLIKSYWQEGDGERRRRYYRLTDRGLAALKAQRREWLRMHEVFTQLWSTTPSLT